MTAACWTASSGCCVPARRGATPSASRPYCWSRPMRRAAYWAFAPDISMPRACMRCSTTRMDCVSLGRQRHVRARKQHPAPHRARRMRPTCRCMSRVPSAPCRGGARCPLFARDGLAHIVRRGGLADIPFDGDDAASNFWGRPDRCPVARSTERYGPRTTCYNRFVRWHKAGVWDVKPVLRLAWSAENILIGPCRWIAAEANASKDAAKPFSMPVVSLTAMAGARTERKPSRQASARPARPDSVVVGERAVLPPCAR